MGFLALDVGHTLSPGRTQGERENGGVFSPPGDWRRSNAGGS